MSPLVALAFGLACAVTIPVLIGWFVHRTGGTWAPHPDPKLHRTAPNQYVATVCLTWVPVSSYLQARYFGEVI